MEKILYVDDEPDNLLTLSLSLSSWYDVDTANGGEEALEKFRNHPYKVLITDLRMPEISGLDLARIINKEYKNVVIIILSAYDDNNTILEAMNQGGIFRYLLKPWDINDLNQTLSSAFESFELKEKNDRLIKDLEKKNLSLKQAYEKIEKLKNQLEEENLQLIDEFNVNLSIKDIIGKSKAIKKCFSKVEKVSKSDSTVLLLGNTGTGKELFANAIHKLSNRNSKVLIKINCAAIPPSLIESELFGHEKGAFTGADKLKYGKFELANKSSIFLDEIGELPFDMQAKLLRVIQEGEFERIGGMSPIKADFRIIAATNRNLEEEVKNGKFRADLFYRLNVVPLLIPSLAERKEDIPLLINYFIEKFNRTSGRNINSIAPNDLSKLMNYSWPGNIRELENIIERAHVMSTGNKLVIGSWFSNKESLLDSNTKELSTLEENEKEHITKILKHTKWKIRGKNGAAEILDMNPSTLDSRIKKLHISRPI